MFVDVGFNTDVCLAKTNMAELYAYQQVIKEHLTCKLGKSQGTLNKVIRSRIASARWIRSKGNSCARANKIKYK